MVYIIDNDFINIVHDIKIMQERPTKDRGYTIDDVYVGHRRPSVYDAVYLISKGLGYVFIIKANYDNPERSECVPYKIDNDRVDVLSWARTGYPNHRRYVPSLLNNRLVVKHKKVDVPDDLLIGFVGYFDLPHLIKDNEHPENNSVKTGSGVFDETRKFVDELEKLGLF